MDRNCEVSSNNYKAAMQIQYGLRFYESPGAPILRKYANVPNS